LDAATKLTIERGRRNLEILKQPQYSPVSVEEQVAIIFVSTKGYIDKVPVERVREFEKEFLGLMKAQHADALKSLKEGKLEDNVAETMAQLAKELSAKYSK
jgi:F-type H+/Na+-transporting ATPase subunit alpha